MYQMNFYRKIVLALWLLLALIPIGAVQSAGPGPLDLIAEVNAYRQAQGLPNLEVDNTLMLIAQNQSDYLANTFGTNTSDIANGHLDAMGGEEKDRAQAVGYDLGPGWYIDETWAAELSTEPVSDVIYQKWAQSPVHNRVLLHTDISFVGAGISEVDGINYYILVVSGIFGSGGSGGGAAATVPTTAVTVQVAPVKVATPDAEGKIFHEVETGQALWSIAAAYEVTIDQLQALNSLTENDFIYTGQKLLIQQAFTPTVSPTTTTTSRPPTRTPNPAQTAEAVVTQTPDQNAEEGGFLNLDRSTIGLALVLVSGVGLALMVISIASRGNEKKKKKEK